MKPELKESPGNIVLDITALARDTPLLLFDAADPRRGREIPLEVSFGEYKKDGKHFFTGFARDISDRKESEEAIRRNEEDSADSQIPCPNSYGWQIRMAGYSGTTRDGMNTPAPHLNKWKAGVAVRTRSCRIAVSIGALAIFHRDRAALRNDVPTPWTGRYFPAIPYARDTLT